MDIKQGYIGYPATSLKEFRHWSVQLRINQVTIGSLVLINKSDAESLGELTHDEWVEFAEVTNFAENLLKQHFPVKKFNYLALMMGDPRVHFHMIPRYSDEVEFCGRIFHDPDWPQETHLNAIELDEKIFIQLLEKLRPQS